MPEIPVLLPLATGEAIFAPCFDSGLAPTLPLRLEAGVATSARRSQFWCGVLIEWDDCAAGKEGATLAFDAPLPQAPWTQAVCCLTLPDHLAVRLEWRDPANRWHAWGPSVEGTATRLEIERDLPAGGATATRLVFLARRPGAGAILVSWLGVRQRPLYDDAWRQRPSYRPDWPGLIRAEAEWTLQPKLGFLFGAEDLARIRARRDAPTWREVWAFLRERAELSAARPPEPDIQDFVPWNDERFTNHRERGRGEWYLSLPIAALVGLVDENPRLIRHALRLLMCVLHTRHWTCSPECRTPGSTWDIRCFLEEFHATAVALAYDWLGGALTPAATDLLATSLWDKGIAVIERDLAKHENIHRINQAPWFNRGRMLASLVLEPLWTRNQEPADRVLRELDADLGRYLQTDGGADEGPNYLATTQEVTLVAYTAYARRRGLDVRKVLPPTFPRSADYYGTLASGVAGEFTTEGDAVSRTLVSDALPILAMLYPDRDFSKWARGSLPKPGVFNHSQNAVGTGLYAFLLGPENVPPVCAPQPERRVLTVTGLIADQREQAGRSLRLQVIGCKARPSHSHRDKGALVAELDGEPVFIDRGMIRYDDFRHHLLKRSEMHNVLTPLLSGDGAPDQSIAECKIVPEVSGETGRFTARVALDNVWREWMTDYTREIDSAHLEGWEVRDVGNLRTKSALCFHLHSPHPFVFMEGRWHVQTPRVTLGIDAPWAARHLMAPHLIDSQYRPINHLRLISAPSVGFNLRTVFYRVNRS